MKNDEHQACRILLRGRVQGIGLRPAVLRWAADCHAYGWLVNTSMGVEIHAEGTSSNVAQFLKGLTEQLPSEAEVSSIHVDSAECMELTDFRVHHRNIPLTPNLSHAGGEGGNELLNTAVPVDTVICEECLAEVMDSKQLRRHVYAFNSCACCGPRYSLIHRMPFERNETAMAVFLLCDRCRSEYEDANNRRLHAQTISCHYCGPRLHLDGTHEPLEQAISLLRDAKIIAIRGIGGYQLVCDATQHETVALLRQRKGRPTKPLAIMVKDLAMALKYAEVAGLEAMLTSKAGPILLCPAKADSPLTASIHPGLADIGIMLPTSALHHLLCCGVNRPLVVTSGNREGEPLAYTKEVARSQLVSICDAMLHHNREICRPIDDSVVRKIAGRTASLRLARGFAPLSLPIQINQSICALGGQQKATIAFSNGKQAILGPHIGDLDSIASQRHFQEHYESLCQLYGSRPSCLVHDLHPDYFTTRWAEAQGLPTLAVQHHHAHIVSGMLEPGWHSERVLGFAFDGTGLGDDGTIWGGEILECTAQEYRRLGHLRPFPLLGGEQSIRQPHRVALVLLHEIFQGDELSRIIQKLAMTEAIQSLLPLLSKTDRFPLTSSMGRLFDGITSLMLGITTASYEGEPAMRLEAICDSVASESYPFPFVQNQLDWRPLLTSLMEDVLRKVETRTIAMRFHRSIAEAVANIASQFPSMPIVLSGGCFQNKILVELIADRLDNNRMVALPGIIPCNDGGLAAGQLAIASTKLNAWKAD